jgi:predicted permease
MAAILNLMIPIFILILLGYFLRKKEFLSQESADGINKLVYYIALPALIFKSIASFSFESIFSLGLILNFYIATILIMIIAFFISVSIKRSIRGALVMCSFRGNLAYLGLPVVTFAFGEIAGAIAAIIIGFAVPLYVTLSVILLSIYNKEKAKINLKLLIKDIFINPLIMGVVLGLIFSIFNLSLPIILDDTIKLIARISLPLILLIIGFTISLKEIKNYIALDSLTSFLKLILLPIIGIFVFKFLFAAPFESIRVAILMLGMPTAVASFVFAKELKADEKYTVSQVGFSTLVSLITIPILIMILGG